jgi:hypothetical protein
MTNLFFYKQSWYATGLVAAWEPQHHLVCSYVS